jgi:hypothetical protein
MRRRPIALAVIAVIAACGGAACGPDLPERMWRSENVRYFSRTGDGDVCPAILGQLEEHGQVIADLLQIDRTLVSYYKFDGLGDFAANAECGAGAAGCAPNASVRSPAGFDRHELIHAYLAPYGRPPWLLTEGAAVALSCERTPRPSGSWRDSYDAPHSSTALYAAGGWLVGYMLRMFRATWMVQLYNVVPSNATADEFADAFAKQYKMKIDDVWAAAISEAQAPMRCVWECSRPELALDQPARPLEAPCGTGSTQLSVELPAGSVTRWRVEGDGRFFLRSCAGDDEPAISVSGGTGAGELLAPLVAGHYFVDAYVEPNGTPTLAATTNALPQLSAIDCATASAVPDDVAALGNLSIFYPSSVGSQFTSLATGTDRPTNLTVVSEDAVASFDLCTSCDTQSCAHGTAGSGLGAPNLPAGSILSVPPGPARTVTFNWF